MRTPRLLPLLITVLWTALPAMSAEKTPSEVYKEIHAQELAASKYEALLVVRSKRSIAKDEPKSPEETKMMFGLLKIMMPKKVEVTGEEIKGDEAFVHVTAPPGPDESPSTKTTGVVVLFKENGVWKLDSEKWESKTELTGSEKP